MRIARFSIDGNVAFGAVEGDQPAGGGNLYCFSLADRRLSCDWTPIEKWQGWM